MTRNPAAACPQAALMSSGGTDSEHPLEHLHPIVQPHHHDYHRHDHGACPRCVIRVTGAAGLSRPRAVKCNHPSLSHIRRGRDIQVCYSVDGVQTIESRFAASGPVGEALSMFFIEGVMILFVQDTDPLRWNQDQLKSFLRHRLSLGSDPVKYDAVIDNGVNAEVLFISSVDRLVQLGFGLPHAILIENTSGAVNVLHLESECLT